jgi:predicted nucleic acid-binding Zn ribbon protein
MTPQDQFRRRMWIVFLVIALLAVIVWLAR